MRTLADAKRRVKPGTRLETVSNTRFPGQAGIIREVAKAQTKDFASRLIEGAEKVPSMKPGDLFWTTWPKAAGFTVVDDDTFSIDFGGDCVVTLRFLDAA